MIKVLTSPHSFIFCLILKYSMWNCNQSSNFTSFFHFLAWFEVFSVKFQSQFEIHLILSRSGLSWSNKREIVIKVQTSPHSFTFWPILTYLRWNRNQSLNFTSFFHFLAYLEVFNMTSGSKFQFHLILSLYGLSWSI